jgi:hypothetical protein
MMAVCAAGEFHEQSFFVDRAESGFVTGIAHILHVSSEKLATCFLLSVLILIPKTA